MTECIFRVVVSDEIKIDRGELRRLIENGFAGIDPDGVEVRVERAARSRESFTGRAYPQPPRRPKPHPGTRYLVRLKLPRALRNRGYPQSYRYPRRKTAPWIVVHDWRERFVALVAHEAFHVRQFREGLRRSEVAAERWAFEVLLRIREGGREAALEPGSWGEADRPTQLTLFG
ncbi:MAG: hypothetical protein ACRDHO_13470 [Actinomycetota bacterium]